MLKVWSVFLLLLLLVTHSQATTLIGWSVMPADTFATGPTSGQSIEAMNGREPPFVDKQPVQGFSALLATDQQEYYVLSDNGFGTKDNSSDYLLGWYLIKPQLKRENGGSGEIEVRKITHLSDPSHYLSFELVRESDRMLTGADLDPESMQLALDGSFWIGDEFFPALLHFNAQGELLAPPFTLPGLSSSDNPMGTTPTLRSSRGFEGMAQSQDGQLLYPMLEGALQDAPAGLNIYSFDVDAQKFINKDASHPSYRYRLDEGSTAVGDFTLFSDSAGLVIERDSRQGPQALTKKIYRVDFGHLDPEGFLSKTLVADLLDIKDPHDLNQDGQDTFRFSFWTIEGLAVLDATTIAISNDNNYPTGNARSKTEPDNTEFILLKIAPLWD